MVYHERYGDAVPFTHIGRTKMQISVHDLLECGWMTTGIAGGMAHIISPSFIPLAISNPSEYQTSVLLIIGFIATGLGMIGTKLLELYQKWRQINSDSDHGKWLQCQEHIQQLTIDYERRLKSKDDENKMLSETNERFRKIMEDQVGMIEKLSGTQKAEL